MFRAVLWRLIEASLPAAATPKKGEYQRRGHAGGGEWGVTATTTMAAKDNNAEIHLNPALTFASTSTLC